MGREFTPRESYAFEQYNIKQGGFDKWEYMRRLTWHYNGQSDRVYSDEEIALRQQFPVLGRFLEPFQRLYDSLSKINGGLDLLHLKDEELAEYINTNKGDVNSTVIKWFNCFEIGFRKNNLSALRAFCANIFVVVFNRN